MDHRGADTTLDAILASMLQMENAPGEAELNAAAKRLAAALDQQDATLFTALTGTSTGRDDGADGTLTLDRLQETIREFRGEEAQTELDVFLSDNWGLYQALKNPRTIYCGVIGGKHVFYTPPEGAFLLRPAPVFPRY
jgi:hypothetical protein